jgi:ferredoxin
MNGEKAMRVRVDLNVCQGHGVCHMSAPDVYELDAEDGHSIVMVDPVPTDMEKDAQLGVDSCPERAIAVE